MKERNIHILFPSSSVEKLRFIRDKIKRKTEALYDASEYSGTEKVVERLFKRHTQTGPINNIINQHKNE